MSVGGHELAEPVPPKSFWDERFAAEAYAYGERASRLLISWANDIQAKCKTALVPACGEGRDAVFLAGLGLDVTAIDLSTTAIEKTKALAAKHGVTVNAIEADLLSWQMPKNEFDVVAMSFAHMPSSIRSHAHPKYEAALTPGGFLFVEGFSKAQIGYQAKYKSGGPQDIDMLYDAGLMSDEFSSLTELSLMSGVETLFEGPMHSGPAALVRAVYQKEKR